MSDIFISYARPDREHARRMAAEFEQRGWSVWWDHEIPPGRNFDDVIEEALAEARCVVVLWSQASTASGWVRNEAGEAMKRDVLIPALIDADVKIPLGFRRLQAADLSRWEGGSSVEFEQFCEAIARHVGAPGEPKVPTPVPPPAVPPRRPAVPPESVVRPVSPPPASLPPRPPEATPPPAASKRSPWLWVGGVFFILVLAGIASMLAERDGGQPPAPIVGGGGVTPPIGTTPSPSAGAGFRMKLAWYDYALLYAGTLSWDGRSNAAALSVDVVDGQTRQSLGHREVQAYGHAEAPGQHVFSTQIPVSGDSRTAGAHVHNVNLVFEQQRDGSWVLVRNCMGPGNCYEIAR